MNIAWEYTQATLSVVASVLQQVSSGRERMKTVRLPVQFLFLGMLDLYVRTR